MIKKIISFILVGILTFTILAQFGCKKPGQSNTDGDKITLKFMYIWPEHKTAMNKSLAMFNEKFPDIIVDATVIPYNQVDQVLQTQISGGSVPDVFFQWTHQMRKWVDLNAALDLTPYITKDKQWKDSFYNQGSWDLAKFDGKYYNTPFRATEFVIGYNKEMFDKNKWVVPNTLQEFEALMETINSKGVIPFACFGKPGGGTVAQVNSVFNTYLNIQTGIVTDTNFKTGRLEPNSDITYAVGSAQKTKAWLNKGWIGKSAMGISREDAQNLFINKKAAMFLLNNNEIGVVSEGLGSPVGAFAFPSPEDMKEKYVFGGFDGFCVSADTEFPDESVELLKFLTSKEIQQFWADNEKSVMVRSDTSYQDELYNVLKDAMQYTSMYDTMGDYNVGEYASISQDLITQYLLDSKMTATEFVTKQNELSIKAIKSSGKPLIKPTYIRNQNVNVDWLYTIK